MISVNINCTSPAPYIIGSTITFQCLLNPPTPGLTYVWIDGDDYYSGTDLDEISINIGDGKFNRKIFLNIIDGDKSYSASLAYVAQYEVETVQPIVPAEDIKRKTNNLELFKWLSYMPKWSFARQSHLSNFSKVTNYAYGKLTDIFSGIFGIKAANTIGMNDTFESTRYEYRYYMQKQPKEIKTNMGIYENIGLSDYCSFDSYPITNCYMQNKEIYEYEYEYDTDSKFERSILDVASYLYITLRDNQERIVGIVGLDKDGKLIQDRMLIKPRISHKTSNKYKAIIGIYSDVSVILSTLCVSDSYVNGISLYKRIVDRNGEYFEPFFKVNEIDPTVLDVKKIDNSDVYRFKLERPIDKFVITENLDMLYISDNILYSCKLYLDTELNIDIHPTFNNNTICYISNDDATDGEFIIFNIDTSAIRMYNKSFLASITNTAKEYISKDMQLSSDKIYLDATKLPSSISIKKQKTNNLPYILSIEVENIKEVFQCGVIDNNIASYKLSDDVYDISVYNGEIYIHMLVTAAEMASKNNEYEYHSKVVDDSLNIINTLSSNSNIMKIIPLRGCFKIKNNSAIVNNPVDIIELRYDWIWKNRLKHKVK